MPIPTGEKSHTCYKWKKQFSRVGFLRTHMLVHTGEKLHTCNIRKKQFSRAGNLRTHMLFILERNQILVTYV